MRRGAFVAAVVAIVAAIAACTSTDSESHAPPAALADAVDEWGDEPPTPAEHAVTAVQAVHAGDVGVVLDASHEPATLHLVRDGRWATLPRLPEDLDNFSLGVAGQGLLLTGLECPTTIEKSMADGVAAAYRFDPAERKWRALELSAGDLIGEDAITVPVTNVDGSLGVLPAGVDDLAVNSLGDVLTIEGSRSVGTVCTVDNRAVGVTPLGSRPEVAVEVRSFDLADPEASWQRSPTRAQGSPPVVFMACGAKGPIFLGDGVEAVYDLERGRWHESQVALPVHLDPQRTALPRVSQAVVLDDGTVVATTGSRAVVRRTTDGEWEDLHRWADVLVTDGTRVYAASREHPTFQPLA